MKKIRGKNSLQELIVRSYLHKNGFRYRIHDKKLPGKPDIVLRKYKTVIFVNGCFWHQHQGCKRASIPKTNTEFWKEKLDKNVERDHKNIHDLENLGWKVIVIWACEINEKNLVALAEKVAANLS